ncbi:MAG: hypothetical protein HC842_03255 [Cytophagales bacterium]|nr:hypothetical protein [Cytophagales bacterium]
MRPAAQAGLRRARRSNGTDGPHIGWYQGPGLDLVDVVMNTTLYDFGTITSGFSSGEQQLSISASNVKQALLIIAPPGFQVSLSQAFTGKTDTLMVTPTGGNVTSQTVFLRFAPSEIKAYSAALQVGEGDYFLQKPLLGIGRQAKLIYVKSDASPSAW